MSTFDVEVISDPVSLLPNRGFDFEDPLVLGSAEYDTRLIKPAVLFADRVNLVSSRSTVHHSIGLNAWRLANMPQYQIHVFLRLSIRQSSKDFQLLDIGPEDLADSAEASSLLKAVEAASGDAALDVFNELVLPFWDSHAAKVDTVVDSYLRVWQARHDALIAEEIKLAIDRGVVTIQAWGEDVPPDERLFVGSDEFLAGNLRGIMQRLQDPSRVALVDPSLSAAPRQADRTRRPSFVANAVVSRVAGLDDLPMIEVLDLREDLKDYLPHFRSEMIRLSEEISDSDNDEAVVAAVDRHWHRDIMPALEEIRREVAAARYPRRLLDAVTSDPGAITASAGALTIAAGGLALGLGTLVPALAAAAYPFLKARAEMNRRHDDARKNKLFFLYAVQDDLSRT